MPEPAEEITGRIIGCAIEVHRQLGPGLLEKHYESALCEEMKKTGLRYKQQYPVQVIYKQKQIDKKYRLDLVVEDQVVVEIKSISKVLPVHVKQVNSYLQISQLPIGLVLNFNEKLLKQGVRRVYPSRQKRTLTKRNALSPTSFSLTALFNHAHTR